MVKVRIAVLVEPAEVERLDQLAQHHHVSRGELVRQALRWWCDWCVTHGGQPPAPPPLYPRTAEGRVGRVPHVGHGRVGHGRGRRRAPGAVPRHRSDVGMVQSRPTTWAWCSSRAVYRGVLAVQGLDSSASRYTGLLDFVTGLETAPVTPRVSDPARSRRLRGRRRAPGAVPGQRVPKYAQRILWPKNPRR